MTFDFRPLKHFPDNALITPTASVLGRVEIGSESSVWFGAVVRGDTEWIRIGNQVNIQDQAVLHADRGLPCEIDHRVTVGHGAIVHGATVESDVMIGIRAVVLNGAQIGRGSLIAANCLIPENCVIPPNSVVMGLPGKVTRETNAADQERIAHAWRHYVKATRDYLNPPPIE